MEYFDGVRTYIEESQPGEWIHVVDAADGERTYIYRDRAKRDSEVYARNVSPQAGGAPLRIGTRDLNSFFAGEIHGIGIRSRLLTDTEIAALYNAHSFPSEGLGCRVSAQRGRCLRFCGQP